MNQKQKTVKLSIKAADDKGTFEGYASVFDVVDAGNDMVKKGAFIRSLAKHKSDGTMPKLLWQHDHQEPIGKFLEIREDDHGLFVRGELFIEDDPLAARAHAHLKRGGIDGLSIGYELNDAEWDEENRVLKLLELHLWEASIVTFPMNNVARVSEVKTQRDLEKFARATGYCSQTEAKELASKFEAKEQREVVESIKSLTETLNSCK